MRNTVFGLIGFLTLVDLFAAQAILPSLVAAYEVSPAAMGFAVNASTMGMAAACLGVALVSHRLDRRSGIWMSLGALSVPTALLSVAPDLATFTLLRIVQGVFMASAFTLTMTYLAEHCSAEEAASALAAYVTGIVASNLIGRLIAASAADALGLPATFYLFAGLNVAGAALVLANLDRMRMMASDGERLGSPLDSWREHLGNSALRASFGIGFLILFAFIGTFTYVNFVLTRAPLSVGQMSVGLVYLVFLPSLVTTPLAGRAAVHFGAGRTMIAAFAVAGLGLPLLVLPSLPAVLAGMLLIAAGTFFAQAAATGFVGRNAVRDRAAASGLYLTGYYLGGLVGAFVLGQVFDRLGWEATVLGIGASLGLAALLALGLEEAVGSGRPA